jgi:predicted ATPase/DNA-binding winged helix-turn-helix (wHTH) protein
LGTSYRFGPVEVRPAERQLLVEGQPAPVGARAFDVLLALIDRRDRVVTKNELLEIVWPGLVVEENNLQVQVSTLRKHLGPRAVATIPGHGYRFTLQPEAEASGRKADAAPQHNLPAQLNRFIGRESDLAEVKALIERSRLVTLTSVGGTGKTRLSLQVAQELMDRFADGAWFVELAPVADESRVAQAVAAVLGVQETGASSMLASLGAWARNRSVLLVLDNCEHLLCGCAELAKQMLQAAPGLRILASSREALRVNGESVYPLGPLAVPDARNAISSAILEQYDAVRLFVERAAAANGSFRITDANARAVASICQQLDGIPLAIELAAARARALSAENIASRLDDCFRLLTGGDKTSCARQQTLRASLDWSHDLLSPPEAVLLRRLSVFSGGWTLDAAENICAGGEVAATDVMDLLTHLVEKSLVETDAFGERYRLLETVRQYARAKLEASGETAAVRGRHVTFYLAFVHAARPHVVGPSQAGWLRRLDGELENLLAAHAYCESVEADAERELELVVSMKRYLVTRGRPALAHQLTREALARAPGRTRARCIALFDAGQLSYLLGRYAEARGYLHESVEIARECGEKAQLSRSLELVGLACRGEGDALSARRYLDDSLAVARDLGDGPELMTALNALAQLLRMDGELVAAASFCQEALAIARRIGDRESEGVALLNLAMASNRMPPPECARLLLQALQVTETIGSRYVGLSVLDVAAGLAAATQAWERAARYFGAAEAQGAAAQVCRDPADNAFLAPLVARARAALPAPAFQLAEAAGRACSYEEIITEVRDWLEGIALTARQ